MVANCNAGVAGAPSGKKIPLLLGSIHTGKHRFDDYLRNLFVFGECVISLLLMSKSPRRTDADYVRFPPYHVFQSSNQRSRRDIIDLAWRTSLIVGAFSVAVIAAFLLIRQYFTGV